MDNINIFDTRTMLAALEERRRPRRYLLDTFFPTVEESLTEHVDIDVQKKGRDMAPFVNPIKEGVLVERTGYTTRSIKPPYLKPKMKTTAADLLKRAFGQHAYAGTQSMAQRAAEQLARDLADLQDMIERREEWMASQALTTGAVTVVGEGVNATIDFQMSATHKPVLVGTDQWSDAGSKPLEDLRRWKSIIAQDSGLTATNAIFGEDALNAFLAHDDVQKALDSRRNTASNVSFDQLPDGVEFIGVIENLSIAKYSEWFLPDGASVESPMVPADGVIIGAQRARTARHYAAIQDVEFGLASLRWFPKSWVEKDPSAQMLLLQSAPLVVPHQIDAFLFAVVL